MTELEMINRAKTYIDKLANGVNPLTDEPVSENDIVNNVRIYGAFSIFPICCADLPRSAFRKRRRRGKSSPSS